MIIAWLAFFDSLLAVAMLAAELMAGAHWHWMTPILGIVRLFCSGLWSDLSPCYSD